MTWIKSGDKFLLCKVVRAREGFATIWARVGSFLSVCSHVSKQELVGGYRNDDAARGGDQPHKYGRLGWAPRVGAKMECKFAYRLRCSNLLKTRPHDGIGQEWDFCEYGPSSIMVALLALRMGPGAERSGRFAGS